jgi:hypothetical protein
VLDRLTPAERLAFVLHDMFAAQFEETAPIRASRAAVRTPSATRCLPKRGSEGLNWIVPIHDGKAFGVIGRAWVMLVGLVPAILGVTGLMRWWQKRPKHATERRSASQPAEARAPSHARLEAKFYAFVTDRPAACYTRFVESLSLAVAT